MKIIYILNRHFQLYLIAKFLIKLNEEEYEHSQSYSGIWRKKRLHHIQVKKKLAMTKKKSSMGKTENMYILNGKYNGKYSLQFTKLEG
jgi:hypothetical protein